MTTPSRRSLENEELFGSIMNRFWEDQYFKVDIKETPQAYELFADLPGFTKEEITVEYVHDLLSISAAHEVTSETEGRYLRRERSTSSFQRQFTMQNIQEDAITAKFENGVLQLNLPKNSHDEPESRKIPIE